MLGDICTMLNEVVVPVALQLFLSINNSPKLLAPVTVAVAVVEGIEPAELTSVPLELFTVTPLSAVHW